MVGDEPTVEPIGLAFRREGPGPDPATGPRDRGPPTTAASAPTLRPASIPLRPSHRQSTSARPRNELPEPVDGEVGKGVHVQPGSLPRTLLEPDLAETLPEQPLAILLSCHPVLPRRSRGSGSHTPGSLPARGARHRGSPRATSSPTPLNNSTVSPTRPPNSQAGGARNRDSGCHNDHSGPMRDAGGAGSRRPDPRPAACHNSRPGSFPPGSDGPAGGPRRGITGNPDGQSAGGLGA